MNPKLILCLALVLSVFITTVWSQETNIDEQIKKEGNLAMQQPPVVPFDDYLFIIGDKLGCYFTLEYQSYSIVRKLSGVFAIVTNDLSVASIPMLVSKLRHDMKEFTVEQDSKNPKIIHIVEHALEQQKDYVLNKKINVQYAGDLVNCVVKDTEGRNLVHGEGIVNAVAKKTGDIRNGTEEAGSQGAFNDCFTVVSVNATNETVRSIFTDCLPLAEYKTVLWRAVTTKENGEPMTLVQFYGTKKP